VATISVIFLLVLISFGGTKYLGNGVPPQLHRWQ